MATETKDPQKKSNAITRFLGEFKEFISKGNVLDMAVGVVVGSAFTAIVNALVDNVLMPLVGAVIAGINFQDLGFHIPWGNHPYINIGAFLSAVITFLITAFCVFLIVKAVNTMRNLTFKKKEEEKKIAEIKAKIKDAGDLVAFMYDHCVACAEEYTDWTARRAVKEIAKEMLGLDLEL